MHVLFLTVALLILLLWREKRQDRYLLLAAGVVGLAMTHNLTSGLLPTAALFVLLVEPRKVLDWRVVLGGAGVFLLSLLPYAYLPIRARMDPPLKVQDPSDWKGFKELVTGGEFKEKMWAFGPEELPARFELYLGHLSGQLHWVVVLVALVGVVYTLVRDRAGFLLLAVPFSGFLLYALEYDIEDVHYYFIPTYAFLALWASVGLAALGREARVLARGVPKLGVAAPAAVCALVLAPVLWDLPGTFREADMSGDRGGSRIVETVAENAAEDAIVIQHRSPLHHMKLVEGRREDVTLWGFDRPNDRGEVAEALEAIRERRLYVVPSEGKVSRPETAGYRLVPVEGGALYEVVPKGEGA